MISAAGCAIQETYDNRQKINQLRIGMTKEQVKKIMGEPLSKESYATPRVWYYYTKNQWFDGAVTRDETTPVVFNDDGVLEGWGTEYLNDHYKFGNWNQNAVHSIVR